MGNNITIQTTPGLWAVLSLVLLILPLPWIAALTISMMIHELFHYSAVRLAGGKVIGMRISYDGFCLKCTPMQPLDSALCSLAGPLGALTLLFFARWIPRTALCAAVQSAYHLLPIYPLDGGRALRSLGEYFGWTNRTLSVFEVIALAMVAWFGAWLSIYKCLGIIPLVLAVAVIFRTFHEKYLANRA